MNLVGDICLDNIKTADNLLAGIEIELANAQIGNYARICSALVVGRSENADYLTN